MKYEKIVEFDKWCRKCKHLKVPGDEEPCNTCLEVGGRDATHKPVNYEEGNNGKKRI